MQRYHDKVSTYRHLKEWLSFCTAMEDFSNLQHFPSQPDKQSTVSSNCPHLSPSLSSVFLSPEFVRRSLEGSWVPIPLCQGQAAPLLSDPLSILSFLPRREGAGRGELWAALWVLALPALSLSDLPLFPLCTVLRWRRPVLQPVACNKMAF